MCCLVRSIHTLSPPRSITNGRKTKCASSFTMVIDRSLYGHYILKFELHLCINSCKLALNYFRDKTQLKSEFAVILAVGQLQTIHSSVLYARGSRQRYATSCCVTVLYICNVIFSPQRDTSHGVKLVSKWPWFPLGRGNLSVLSLTLIGSSDWTSPPPSFPPPSAASWGLLPVLVMDWRWTTSPMFLTCTLSLVLTRRMLFGSGWQKSPLSSK